MEKERNDNCTFCGKLPETLLHLFVECEQVEAIWKQMQEYREAKFQISNLDFSAKNIFVQLCSL